MLTELIFVVKTNPLKTIFFVFLFVRFCESLFFIRLKKILTELTISIPRTDEMNIQINPLEEEIQQLKRKQNKL